MEIPTSTPSAVIQHDFGIIDLSIEIMAEKIILAAEILNSEEESIEKSLLTAMLEKKVPGFCEEVHEALKEFGIKSIETVKRWKNIRNEMKKKVITYQKYELFKNMIQITKPDGVTLNFNFNGNESCYLKLPLKKARIVLLLRSRMFLTKANFQGRWENEICDFCGRTENDFQLLLAETMTCVIKINDCVCITANKSIGQNVAIIKRNKMKNIKTIKIYEPNETVNMMGIKLQILNNNIRLYTAHFKQESTSSRDEIANQFYELEEQFKSANLCNEGMLVIFDSNVHVGDEIKNCMDKKDWGGKLAIEMIKNENLILLNKTDLCKGIVTRIDPRNGKESTIDLAIICNRIMAQKVSCMVIDEEELLKPTNYTSNKLKKTDHNTILIKLIIPKLKDMKGKTFRNIKNEKGRSIFEELINGSRIRYLFDDINGSLTDE